MKKSNLCLVALISALVLAGGDSNAGPTRLEQEFRSVPDTDRPWVYWWWLKGNVDEETSYETSKP